MFFVGLTGGIASGKSTVAKIFVENGIPVIDADTMARKVVEPGRKAWKKLRKEFGKDIFHDDGTLNREKLSQVIFADTGLRRKLNEITHPEIIKEMVIAACSRVFEGHKFVVLDIPLLYETGELVKFMHKIIVVNCTPEQQLARLMARQTCLTEEDARRRIAAQMPLESKCEAADLVVDNSMALEETRRQVLNILADLRLLKFHIKVRVALVAVTIVFIVTLSFLVYYFTASN